MSDYRSEMVTDDDRRRIVLLKIGGRPLPDWLDSSQPGGRALASLGAGAESGYRRACRADSLVAVIRDTLGHGSSTEHFTKSKDRTGRMQWRGLGLAAEDG